MAPNATGMFQTSDLEIAKSGCHNLYAEAFRYIEERDRNEMRYESSCAPNLKRIDEGVRTFEFDTKTVEKWLKNDEYES
jgi:hypothetical protein